MKKLLIAVLSLMSVSLYAETSEGVFNLINNTEDSITVSYNLCEWTRTFNPIGDTNKPNDTNAFECTHKTVTLNAKNSGSNQVEETMGDTGLFYRLAKLGNPSDPSYRDTSGTNIKYSFVLIEKITSKYGEQNFMGDYKELIAKTELGSTINLDINLPHLCKADLHENALIMDNLGTDKIFCQSTRLAQ